MSLCPSCGRYVGPYEACPYCGARLSGRLPVRVVKIAALLLATVGLAALWFAAAHAEAPLISIDQAGATMNMAYVRVEGWVVRGPTFDPESGYLAFTVGDDSGEEMRVSVYRQQSEALRAAGNIPALGDRVSVAGTLRVREDNVAMTLNVPEHLQIVRPEAEPRDIGSITADDQFRRVRVRGQVWAVSMPYEGLTLITLRDASGAIDVAVDESLQALTGALLPLEVGQSAEVTAAVSLYRDTPQLVPASVLDLRPLTEEVSIAERVNVSALAPADAGRMVVVEGAVAEVDSFSAGVKFGLDDGTGRITVLLWQDLYDRLPDPSALTAGAQVRVMGEVSVYRGALEVVPERPLDMVILAAGEGVEAAAPASLTPIASLNVGDTVTVEGDVVGVDSFSAGFKFTLDDGTGRVALLLWLSTYDSLSDPRGLYLGARVRASGAVEEYAGQLQIVPQSGAEVTVLTAGEALPPTRQIAALGPADIDTEVTVIGPIARAEPFSQGQWLWINDGTGEIQVVLWDNIYERLSDRLALQPGATVQISGRLQEYRGALELVPRLPAEVVLIEE